MRLYIVLGMRLYSIAIIFSLQASAATLRNLHLYQEIDIGRASGEPFQAVYTLDQINSEQIPGVILNSSLMKFTMRACYMYLVANLEC